MRSFIITIIIFSLMMLIIGINFVYINSVSNQMSNLASMLTSKPSESNLEIINKLHEIFEENLPLISLSVNYQSIDKLRDAMESVFASNSSNDEALLSVNINLLTNAINELSRLECFSIKNIL